ncbi:MAG TPA: EF-hand domain-containing protein [Steroidobacteraceae bacterium]|nr:EF-hand domain-containing protein [Steroidobacteraceae bacterium]
MPALNDAQLAALRKAFDACDPNADGFIDQNEFHALLKVLDADTSKEECLLDFEATDTEGDGFIGFKEFVAWWTG